MSLEELQALQAGRNSLMSPGKYYAEELRDCPVVKGFLTRLEAIMNRLGGEVLQPVVSQITQVSGGLCGS